MFAFIILKGLAIGLSISMPIGPVGVLCIRRSLIFGRAFGFVTGLGAASADLLCAFATGFGINSVSEILVHERLLLGCIGGALFCLLGLGTIFRRPDAAHPTEIAQASLLAAYSSALFLTIINPLTLLSLVAVFSSLGMGITTGWLTTLVFIFGIGLGAALWWFLLSHAVAIFFRKVTLSWTNAINRCSGVVFFVLGAYLMARSFR